MSEDSEASTSGSTGTPNAIPHNPRKRASGPRFDALPEFRAPYVQAPINRVPEPSPFPTDPAARIAELKSPRAGPLFVQYSMWTGGAAVAYTYLLGFRAIYWKDNRAWDHSIRQRLWIMSPLIAMYIAGSGILPIPFRAQLEKALQRPAISLMDVQKSEKAEKAARKLREQAAEQAQATQQAALS